MKYWFVNTNENYDEGATNTNLLKQEVSFYGSLKELIEDLKTSDKVFLYKKKTGIIAYGEVENEEIIKRPWYDSECWSLNLVKFIDFSNKPIEFIAQGGKFMKAKCELNKSDLNEIKNKLFL